MYNYSSTSNNAYIVTYLFSRLLLERLDSYGSTLWHFQLTSVDNILIDSKGGIYQSICNL